MKQTEETMKTDVFVLFCVLFLLLLFIYLFIYLFFFIFFFGGVRLYVPVNNFSVMPGRSHRFLGVTSTFGEVNVSCSRIQHGDPREDRTPDLSLRSPTLYH